MDLMVRRKKPISYSLDPELIKRLDRWIEQQELQPSKTAVLELAIKEFLDKREKKRQPGRPAG